MRPQDRYDSLIQYCSSRLDLDWRMVKRQVEAESSFRPQAVSPAGAAGLMQFMPGTFAWAVKEMRAARLISDDHEVWIAPETIAYVARILPAG